MSLEKSDTTKLHFTDPVHKVIEMLAEERNLSKKAWMEWVIERVAQREAHKAIMRAEKLQRSGIDKIFRESALDPEAGF